MKRIGVDAISYNVPSIYLSIEELSKNRRASTSITLTRINGLPPRG